MSLLPLSTSQSRMPDTDTGQSSLTPNPVCSPPSTPHTVDIASYIFPWSSMFPGFFQEKDGSNTGTV